MRATRISVTLRATIPQILFPIHAFRQDHPLDHHPQPQPPRPGRLLDQRQDLPHRLLRQLSERRRRDNKIEHWRGKKRASL